MAQHDGNEQEEEKFTEENGAVIRVKMNGKPYAMKKQCAKREIDILSSLKHPCVIAFHSVTPDRELIMEFGEGGDMYKRLGSNGPFSVPDTKILARQMLSAISYIHDQGIVHRDMKLENWVFKSHNSLDICLIDFGMSVSMEDCRRVKSVGSIYYIAPEAFRGFCSPVCDEWGVGVIIYMLLTGSPPFNAATDEEICKKIMSRLVSYDHEVFRDRALREFVSSLLEKHSAQRLRAKDAIVHPLLQESYPRDINDEILADYMKRIQHAQLLNGSPNMLHQSPRDSLMNDHLAKRCYFALESMNISTLPDAWELLKVYNTTSDELSQQDLNVLDWNVMRQTFHCDCKY